MFTRFPKHLEKLSGASPVPIDGVKFRPAMEEWFDPVTETMFWANGRGYFESGAWGLPEIPGTPLVPYQKHMGSLTPPPKSLGGTTYGFDQYKELVADIQKLAPPATGPTMDPPHWWMQQILRELFPRFGVTYRVEFFNDGEIDDPTHFFTNIKGYTEAIDKRVRRYFQFKYDASKMIPNFEPTKKVKEKGLKRMSEEEKLSTQWSEMADKWEEAGLLYNDMIDLFNRVCSDANVANELSEETMALFRTAYDKDMALATKQEEIGSESEQSEEVTEPAKTEEPAEFPSLNEKDAIELERRQAIWLDIQERAKAAGVSEQIKELHQAIGKDNALDELTLGALEETLQKLIKEQQAASTPAPSPAEKAKKTRKKSTKTEKVEEIIEDPPYEEFFESPCTNTKYGDVEPFSEVMSRVDYHVRMRTYHERKIKKHNKSINGIFFLFWGSILEIVHAQFMRQRRADGTFKPPTVETKWGVFRRKAVPNGGPTCTDKAKFSNFLANMTMEERAMYGDAIQVQFTMTDSAAAALVNQGVDVPGWSDLPVDPDADPVGTIYLNNTKTQLNDLKEDIDEDEESKAPEPEETRELEEVA